MVGYWPLDGSVTNWAANTTADVSGNGNTGMLVSLATSTAPVAGKIGQALKFNGSSSYVEAVDSNSFDPPKVTASAWVYPTMSAIGEIVSHGNNTNGWYLELDDTGKLNFRITADHIMVNGTVINNKWQHIVVTHDGTNDRFYINGARTDIITDATAITNYAGPFRMGVWSPNLSFFFPGMLDDVRIYNRVLSAGEVQRHCHVIGLVGGDLRP